MPPPFHIVADIGEKTLHRGAGLPDVTLTVGPLIGQGAQSFVYRGHMSNLGDVVIRKNKTKAPVDKIPPDMEKEIKSLRNSGLSAKTNRRNAANTEGCNPYINCFYGIITGFEPEDKSSPFTYWNTDLYPDHVYTIYEYIEGMDLERRLASPLTREELHKFGQQLLQAVIEMHSKNIAHHDLKPANIMITRDGNLKLIDFGGAISTKLVLNQIVFTPTFLAPEGWLYQYSIDLPHHDTTKKAEVEAAIDAVNIKKAIRSKIVDSKEIDMFAVGCILFQMLTGTQFMETRLITETMSTETYERYLPERIKLVPERFRPLVGGLLSFNKEIIDDLTLVSEVRDIVKRYKTLNEKIKGKKNNENMSAEIKEFNALKRIIAAARPGGVPNSGGKDRPTAEQALRKWNDLFPRLAEGGAGGAAAPAPAAGVGLEQRAAVNAALAAAAAAPAPAAEGGARTRKTHRRRRHRAISRRSRRH